MTLTVVCALLVFIEHKYIYIYPRTHAWTEWLDISSQGLDPVHRDILFIAKVNVKDVSHLLVSGQRLDQASVPVLHIKIEANTSGTVRN